MLLQYRSFGRVAGFTQAFSEEGRGSSADELSNFSRMRASIEAHHVVYMVQELGSLRPVPKIDLGKI